MLLQVLTRSQACGATQRSLGQNIKFVIKASDFKPVLRNMMTVSMDAITSPEIQSIFSNK